MSNEYFFWEAIAKSNCTQHSAAPTDVDILLLFMSASFQGPDQFNDSPKILLLSCAVTSSAPLSLS